MVPKFQKESKYKWFPTKTAAGKSRNFSDLDLAQLKEVRDVKIF